jgi:hypothetical protein
VALFSVVACAGAQSRAVCIVRAGVNLGYGNIPVSVPHVKQAHFHSVLVNIFSVCHGELGDYMIASTGTMSKSYLHLISSSRGASVPVPICQWRIIVVTASRARLARQPFWR